MSGLNLQVYKSVPLTVAAVRMPCESTDLDCKKNDIFEKQYSYILPLNSTFGILSYKEKIHSIAPCVFALRIIHISTFVIQLWRCYCCAKVCLVDLKRLLAKFSEYFLIA